jgi:hypothetical protein
MTYFYKTGSRPKPEDSREAGSWKSQVLKDARSGEQTRRIDGTMAFVICSRNWHRLLEQG